MKAKAIFYTLLLSLSLLAGCDWNQPPPGGQVTEWVLGKANEALESFSDRYSDEIEQALDGLRNAEYRGGPFENNLDSARAYLLEQLQEKYGMEFCVVGRESLTNYGPFAGATYTCRAAPADAPEQVTTALVSQTLYQDVRDSYAVYFFKDEAEAQALALCAEKEYIVSFDVALTMPGTAVTWRPEDGMDKFLRNSGAYLEIKIDLEHENGVEENADRILEFLNDVYGLNANVQLNVRRAGAGAISAQDLFFSKITVLGENPTPPLSRDRVYYEMSIFSPADFGGVLSPPKPSEG